jgi:hypothetical protein
MSKQTFFGPSEKNWSDHASTITALGFNLLRDFEPLMHELYPESKQYNFGYFSEEDLNNQQTIGWKFMTADMFDVENFDEIVGSRFGIRVDVHNRIKHGNNYIMLMSKNHREDVLLPARKALNKKIEAQADEDAIIVHPEDPEFNRMKDAGRELARSEKYKVQGPGEPNRGDPGDVTEAKGKDSLDEW